MDINDVAKFLKENPIGIIAVWTLIALVIGLAAGYVVPRYRRRGKGGKNCVEIYVGNLSYDMKETHLRKEFERYGAVKSARVIINRFNHKSKGFGFVEMPVRVEAEAAIKALHDKDVMGRRLRVNEAKNKARE